MLGIGIVVPFIAVAAIEGTEGSAVATFPPFQCYARSTDVIYYIYILPGCIIMGTGVTFLILLLHAISRHVTSLQIHSVQEQDLRTQVYNLFTAQNFIIILKTGRTDHLIICTD